jgi:hypothetical protein
LKGTVTLSANASDTSGVAWVEFYDGSTLLGLDTSAPYSFDWSSRTAANGPHTLTSKAYDNTGRSGTSAARTITLDNDFVAPTATLTGPAAGSVLQGIVTLSADASDNQNEVARVEFYVDGALLGASTTAPHTLAWDTRPLLNGSHTLMARAYDTSGNPGTSPTLNVTVSNPGAATYNSTLKASSCTTVGASCDSSTRLAAGRGGTDGVPHGQGGAGPAPRLPSRRRTSARSPARAPLMARRPMRTVSGADPTRQRRGHR